MLSLTSLRDCYNTGKGWEGERMEGGGREWRRKGRRDRGRAEGGGVCTQTDLAPKRIKVSRRRRAVEERRRRSVKGHERRRRECAAVSKAWGKGTVRDMQGRI